MTGLSCMPLSVLDQDHQTHPALPAALNKAVRKRQREYLTGRLCACAALRNAGYPRDIYPDMGEDRLPVWPSDWLGSISHSGDYAIAAVAPKANCVALGIDLQQRVALKTMMEIQSLIAQPDELAQFSNVDAITRLLLIFSGKEALYKALYPQVRNIQNFDAAKLIDVDAKALTFRLTRHWSPFWHADKCISVHYAVFDEYVITASYHGML